MKTLVQTVLMGVISWWIVNKVTESLAASAPKQPIWNGSQPGAGSYPQDPRSGYSDLY